MVAPLFHNALYGILQATKLYINRSSWYLFLSTCYKSNLGKRNVVASAVA